MSNDRAIEVLTREAIQAARRPGDYVRRDDNESAPTHQRRAVEYALGQALAGAGLQITDLTPNQAKLIRRWLGVAESEHDAADTELREQDVWPELLRLSGAPDA